MSTSWQSAAIEIVEVGALRIAYRVLGDPAHTPAVLVHSGGLSARQWRRLAESLADRYRVLVPDLIGYGGSTPWPDGAPFAFARDVELLTALVDRLGKPAALVGHSYGGLIAAHVALARPSAVCALALYEPVTFGVLAPDERTELDTLKLVYAPPPGAVGDDAWFAAFVGWWNGPGAWDGLAEDVRASFRAVGWKLFQEVDSLMRDRTPASAYAAVSAPALIMGGERTPAVERRTLELLAAALPHGELRMFAKAGHMGPITHAAEVNAAIVAHLDAHLC